MCGIGAPQSVERLQEMLQDPDVAQLQNVKINLKADKCIYFAISSKVDILGPQRFSHTLRICRWSLLLTKSCSIRHVPNNLIGFYHTPQRDKSFPQLVGHMNMLKRSSRSTCHMSSQLFSQESLKEVSVFNSCYIALLDGCIARCH